MRIFAGDRVKNLMERMGMPDDEPIEHPWVTKSVENAQKKVEERNFDIRKNLLEYDDVMNAQRKTIYDMRQPLLVGRYEPEILDEEGKPTGREARRSSRSARIARARRARRRLPARHVPRRPDHAPRQARATRAPSRAKDFEKAEEPSFVELETLQREVYTRWGVKVELDGPRGRGRSRSTTSSSSSSRRRSPSSASACST